MKNITICKGLLSNLLIGWVIISCGSAAEEKPGQPGGGGAKIGFAAVDDQPDSTELASPTTSPRQVFPATTTLPPTPTTVSQIDEENTCQFDLPGKLTTKASDGYELTKDGPMAGRLTISIFVPDSAKPTKNENPFEIHFSQIDEKIEFYNNYLDQESMDPIDSSDLSLSEIGSLKEGVLAIPLMQVRTEGVGLNKVKVFEKDFYFVPIEDNKLERVEYGQWYLTFNKDCLDGGQGPSEAGIHSSMVHIADTDLDYSRVSLGVLSDDPEKVNLEACGTFGNGAIPVAGANEVDCDNRAKKPKATTNITISEDQFGATLYLNIVRSFNSWLDIAKSQTIYLQFNSTGSDKAVCGVDYKLPLNGAEWVGRLNDHGCSVDGTFKFAFASGVYSKLLDVELVNDDLTEVHEFLSVRLLPDPYPQGALMSYEIFTSHNSNVDKKPEPGPDTSYVHQGRSSHALVNIVDDDQNRSRRKGSNYLTLDKIGDGIGQVEVKFSNNEGIITKFDCQENCLTTSIAIPNGAAVSVSGKGTYDSTFWGWGYEKTSNAFCGQADKQACQFTMTEDLVLKIPLFFVKKLSIDIRFEEDKSSKAYKPKVEILVDGKSKKLCWNSSVCEVYGKIGSQVTIKPKSEDYWLSHWRDPGKKILVADELSFNMPSNDTSVEAFFIQGNRVRFYTLEKSAKSRNARMIDGVNYLDCEGDLIKRCERGFFRAGTELTATVKSPDRETIVVFAGGVCKSTAIIERYGGFKTYTCSVVVDEVGFDVVYSFQKDLSGGSNNLRSRRLNEQQGRQETAAGSNNSAAKQEESGAEPALNRPRRKPTE